jgi:single-strand DNA-binding protein
MNIVEVAGHLGADPETRVTPNGLKITTLRVATNSRRAGKDETIWWRVTIFGDRFDKMLMHLKKGSPVIAIGELNKPEIWMDKEGRPQITLEMVAEMIKFNPFGRPDRGPEGGNAHSSYGQTSSYQNNSYSQQPYGQQGFNTHSQAESSYSETNYHAPGGTYPSHPTAGASHHDEEDLPF